jgi:ribosomal protein S10
MSNSCDKFGFQNRVWNSRQNNTRNNTRNDNTSWRRGQTQEQTEAQRQRRESNVSISSLSVSVSSTTRSDNTSKCIITFTLIVDNLPNDNIESLCCHVTEHTGFINGQEFFNARIHKSVNIPNAYLGVVHFRKFRESGVALRKLVTQKYMNQNVTWYREERNALITKLEEKRVARPVPVPGPVPGPTRNGRFPKPQTRRGGSGSSSMQWRSGVHNRDVQFTSETKQDDDVSSPTQSESLVSVLSSQPQTALQSQSEQKDDSMPYMHILEAHQSRVREEPQSQVQSQVYSRSSFECIVCQSNARQILFHPCNHFVACSQCADEWNQTKGTCPICYAKIEATQKVYT